MQSNNVNIFAINNFATELQTLMYEKYTSLIPAIRDIHIIFWFNILVFHDKQFLDSFNKKKPVKEKVKKMTIVKDNKANKGKMPVLECIYLVRYKLSAKIKG